MSVGMLFQIGMNLIFGLGLFVVFKRLNKPAKDDPRLSRGLQLLQSKIAVLEDLSDRTEVQVSQLIALMEQKCKDVQSKIQNAERHVHLINASIEKSLDVAKIFQDKIPHQEIIERQNTIKYVQAARLAHQGMSLDEIRKKVDLPLGELEFIVKVNRSQLMFSEDDLPAWAQDEISREENGMSEANPVPEAVSAALVQPAPTPQMPSFHLVEPSAFANENHEVVTNLGHESSDTLNAQSFHPEAPQPYTSAPHLGYDPELPAETVFYQSQFEEEEQAIAAVQRDLSEVFEVRKPELAALEKLGEQFRQACQDYEQTQAAPPAPATSGPPVITSPVAAPVAQMNPIANKSAVTRSHQEATVIKKVQFPRINVSDNLR